MTDKKTQLICDLKWLRDMTDPSKEKPFDEAMRACVHKTAEDALKLLTPQVMSIDAVRDMAIGNYDAEMCEVSSSVCWIEEKCIRNGKTYTIPYIVSPDAPDFNFEDGVDEFDNSVLMHYIGSDCTESKKWVDYDVTWRCWNMQPDRDTMEETPWL